MKASLQGAVMAAIVATLALVPIGGLLALLAYLAFGIPLHTLVTFDGALAEPLGVVVWWLVMYVPASIYAMLVAHA